MHDAVPVALAPRAHLPALVKALFSAVQLRRTAMMLVHALLWCAAFGITLELRFEGEVPGNWLRSSAVALELLVAVRFAFFLAVGLFDGLWRYAGMPELRSIVAGTSAGTACVFAVSWMTGSMLASRGVLLGEWLVSICAVGGARFFIRTFYEWSREDTSGTPTLIVGAGDSGESLLRDMQRMRGGGQWNVVGFLDDDRGKLGSVVHGVRVLGPADETTLTRVVRKLAVRLVVLAWPTAPAERTRAVLNACRSLGVQTRTVPGLGERLAGAEPNTVRELNIEDLLHREPVRLDLAQVGRFLHDKVVLVTGAGGSIGSELARQVLRFGVRRLLLLDHDENALFFVNRELRAAGSGSALVPMVADITDADRIETIFRAHHPAVVLHAAAHKHVALMEENPSEAVRNNVFGTLNVATAARAFDAEAFVLISSDKAVRPTSMMGATKRVGEMIVQSLSGSGTRFVAVRFGNVLGSAGSVVPIFREQIARGGPVTVTHPEATRFFMTIPEAAQLVLQAGALGGSGEILVLDMGQSLRVLDLARDLIALAGKVPEVDVPIEFIGLTRGEKLHEELLLEDEGYDRTAHAKILRSRIRPTAPGALRAGLHELRRCVEAQDDTRTRRAISAIVPEAALWMPPQPEPGLLDLVSNGLRAVGEV